ncbi:transcriptional regulator, TetR family [Cohaesibacter sp. ES.047]|uniref:hypothetical protein n=1 Tax=Cohaesibacter sp. ES.047 TaxID=1798205 RepID=UPI000BB79C73|nr:hypothetical protein [Cohaesibacter sp. ES.047]SNY91504.1 transcriptional regulator, TetR family [Cohaesibacter sp. ES.047]
MHANTELRNQLFDQFSRTVLDSGWRDLSCAEIATGAGVEVKMAFVEFSNRYAYVTELVKRIDYAMLDAYDIEIGEEPARERLFDVIMARFEAMQPHRDLIVALTKAARCDPMLSLHLMALSRLTADWFMDVSHISPAGLGGLVRSKGALVAYARAFSVWLDDDTEDLSKTMACLDKTLKSGEKALRRAERLARVVPALRKRCKPRRKSRDRDTSETSGAPEATYTEDSGMAPMPS